MDRWKIWITYYDDDGHVVGYGVHPKDYLHKSSATHKAKQLFEGSKFATWVVSKTRPWSFPDIGTTHYYI